MLAHVIIRSGQTDKECENLINQTIEDFPSHDVVFEMLIENTYAARGIKPEALYTLLIRVETIESEE